MLFRELDMPLKEIAAMMDSPGFDRRAALYDQLELLNLRRERLTRLIALTEDMIKGGNGMDFSAFDDSKEREYAAEARKRWGDTAAWNEYEAKEGARTDDERRSAEDGLTDVFKGFGGLRALAPDDPAVKAQVKKLQGEYRPRRGRRHCGVRFKGDRCIPRINKSRQAVGLGLPTCFYEIT